MRWSLGQRRRASNAMSPNARHDHQKNAFTSEAAISYGAIDEHHTRERHFAFFRQGSGAYVREWKGPVPMYRPRWWHRDRQAALDAWATHVSQPQRGEVGLDVTHIGWPVGDFCYCTFDVVDRRLDWGPPRHYIEVRLDTLEIVANQESHRPIRDAVPGQRVFDITGTALEPYHGQIFGRFVPCAEGWRLEPVRDHTIPAVVQRALEAGGPVGLDAEYFDWLRTQKERVLV